ncbi:hypothetical protein IJI91_01995 [Candidatus Saccharibacteria bacterium]|nr:hypothetical protein [Candidatus Saccharibacteria bacterium]
MALELFEKKIPRKNGSGDSFFFGIVKGGSKADAISEINEGVVGESIGCFAKYADGTIDKLAEIEVNIDIPDEFDSEKVELKIIAGGDEVGPSDLKGFCPDEVVVSVFYDGEPTGCELPIELVEPCFSKQSPQTVQPVDTPAPAPAPSSDPASASPAPPVAPLGYDDEIPGDIHVVYNGENREIIVNTQRLIDVWAYNLEIGKADPSDFSYRKVVEVPGGIKVVSDEHVGVQFRAEHLQQRATTK